MILSSYKSILIVSFVFLISCFFKSTDKNNKSSVRVKFIYQLDKGQSFYWFTDGALLTSEGVNYFQITDNICDLDFKKANAICEFPIGILKHTGDSVFILTQDSIIQKKKSRLYKIIQIDYDFKLRDSVKVPNYQDAFFLRDTCKL